MTHIGHSEKVLFMRVFIAVLVLIFSFQSLTKAETYSCTYKWNDEIRTSVEKRTGSTFTSIYEDGHKAKYQEMIETKDRIILIDNLETVFMKVIWKKEKTFSMIGLSSNKKKHTAIIDGKCRIIK